MGGYNSGRHGWRGIVEQRKRLDIRTFRRRGWLQPGTAGHLTWSSDGEPSGSVSYQLSQCSLKLHYRIVEEDIVVNVHVGIGRSPCRYGGERLYWECPRCRRRCEVIVMATHGREWGCRRCLRLRYMSQGLVASDRMQRRADAIYTKLGDADENGIVQKPKFMRWATFDSLLDNANKLSGEADAAFALRAMRLFKML